MSDSSDILQYVQVSSVLNYYFLSYCVHTHTHTHARARARTHTHTARLLHRQLHRHTDRNTDGQEYCIVAVDQLEQILKSYDIPLYHTKNYNTVLISFLRHTLVVRTPILPFPSYPLSGGVPDGF